MLPFFTLLSISRVSYRSECCAVLKRSATTEIMTLNGPSNNIIDGLSFVTLKDGAELPFEAHPSPLDIIIGHGLGSKPAEKSHRNDVSFHFWKDTLRYLESKRNLSSERSTTFRGTAILYTARGHGQSRGWERLRTAVNAGGNNTSTCKDELDDKPFRWPPLGNDMLQVADLCGLAEKKFVILGQSMGAASGLYLTIDNPERVNGLILTRPPRAWEARQKIASMFVNDARLLETSMPSSQQHMAILGAAHTDLPSRTDKEAYGRVQCPTLILSHGQDDAHPVETGKYLAELIPHAQFETAANEGEARRQWPKIIGDWLIEKGLVGEEVGKSS